MVIGQLADYSRFCPEAARLILVRERLREDLLALATTQDIIAIWPEDDGYEGAPTASFVPSPVLLADLVGSTALGERMERTRSRAWLGSSWGG